MRVLLVYPYCLEDRTQDDDVRAMPIGVYYLAALLIEQGYDVEILNWYRMRNCEASIREILAEKKPDILGLSILHANRWGGIDIARIAKKLNPRVTVVFGGVGATHLWKHLLFHFPVIDYLVHGEGEYPFLELVRALDQGNAAAIPGIKGIALRKNGRIIKTERPAFIKDIDELPNPAKYFAFQHVVSARGCPWNCTFCGSPAFWERKVRFHSAQYFVDQLELLYRQGITFFYVSDDTFTVKSDRVIEICRLILERNLKITWVAISRVNYVNEELLLWMRRAGCIQISFGVESGSKKIRDFLNKNIKTEDIKAAFTLCRRYGILPRIYIIYGSPGEDESTIQASIDLFDEIKPLGLVTYILDIFPGTALYAAFKKKTGLTDDVWLERVEDIMYFETDPLCTDKMILDFGNRLRTAFHANLHCYVEDMDLVDIPELRQSHAEFCSRLAMTFSHGDYARVEAVKNPQDIATRLYEKALSYAHDHRAYLGLGIIHQKNRAMEKSVEILTEGVRHFPESSQLHVCLGISLMNLGRFDQALAILLKVQNSQEALQPIAECYRQLDKAQKAHLINEQQ